MTNPHYPPEFYTDISRYLDNPWLCPYCLAITEQDDQSCPACRQPLVITTRLNQEPSSWLWRAIFFQIALIIGVTGLGIALFTVIVKVYGIASPFPFLPAYGGLPVNRPPAQVETVLTLVSPRLFWSVAAIILYSALMAVLLYLRVKHANTLFLFTAGLTLSAGVTLVLFFNSSTLWLMLGGVTILVGGIQLYLTLNLWGDFTFKTHRLQLTIDKSIRNHTTLYLDGRRYAKQGLWGLAAIHYRRAIGRDPRKAVYHLALAIAYIKLNRFDLAGPALDQAERLDPDAPEIFRLRRQLAQKRPA